MKVKFKEKHLSIDQFNDVELPDFTVLTGVNGSGKSHLLQAIEDAQVEVEDIGKSDIVHFNYETFRLENEGRFNAYQFTTEKDSAWNIFEQHVKGNATSWKNELGEDYRKIVEVATDKYKSIWDLYKKDFSDDDSAAYEKLQKYKQNFGNHFRNNGNLKNNQQAKALFSLIKQSSYSIDEIKREDFNDLYKPFDFKNDFLPSQLGKVIWNYYVKFNQNQSNELQNSKYGKNYQVLSEADFIRKYGEKPWDVINKILKAFDSLDYRINSPEGADPYDSYQLKLIHTKRESLEVDFGALSSGEKVLMALVASVYKTSTDKHFPNLLLLDEVDTSLHPSMIQNLLDVINDIFLSRGVKVILVTHSPTTVAIAPEDSIYVMNKDGKDRIVKTDKNKALSILTEGFATLDEGIKLFDQISRKKLAVITEGHNTDYIQKAVEYFGSAIKNDVEIISGIESRSGKEQLKVLFEFFVRAPHDNQVVFVWDHDMTTKMDSKNNTTPYVLKKNQNNNKVTTGIENLFGEDLFTDEFYIEKPKADGGYHKSLDKNKFKTHILTNGAQNDFQQFGPLIKKLEELLNDKN
jgi:predicted ATPase